MIFLFPQNEISIDNHRFNIIGLIQAESQNEFKTHTWSDARNRKKT